jgi:hypothetical protein
MTLNANFSEVPAPVKEGVRITTCVTCEHPLPTLLISAYGSPRKWECCRCGATYVGALECNPENELRRHLKLLNYFPQCGQLGSNLRTLEHANQMRRHSRHPLMMEIPATQLNADLLPVGENFRIVTRDFSETGIGIIHTRPLEGKFAIVVDLPNAGYVELLFDVVRCERLGDLYVTGGKFFRRLPCRWI